MASSRSLASVGLNIISPRVGTEQKMGIKGIPLLKINDQGEG
tara:strand:+ start:241 stop:366 length:126 start_codon:yes stop_codon:yes gene_type:complete